MENIFPAPTQIDFATENPAKTWKIWLQKFQLYMTALDMNSQSDERKLAILLYCLGDEGVRIYNTFDRSLKYEGVVKQFGKYFAPKHNIIEERFKFLSLRQKENETFDVFLMRLKDAILTCDYESGSAMIRDVFIVGLTDDRLRRKLLNTTNLTLENAETIAAEYFRRHRQNFEGTNRIEQQNIEPLSVKWLLSLDICENKLHHGQVLLNVRSNLSVCQMCGQKEERVLYPAIDIRTENNTPPYPYKFIFNRKAAIITAVILAFVIVLGVVFATTNSVLKRKSKLNWNGEDTRKYSPANTTIGSDNIGGGKILRLVSRGEWLATPPTEPLDKLTLPVDRVVIAHTATEDCSSQATCVYRTRVIQDFHMKSRGFSDIGYNFLVGGDGCVYEGRGWDMQGAHTKGYNVNSIGIAFIGTFTTLVPPEKQLNAAKLIIEEGIRLNKLVPNYRLYGARQLVGSESPGNALFAIIKTWPNWSQAL